MRSSNGNDRYPRLRPVTKVELSENNKKLRLILAVVCLLIAAAALTYALTSALNTDPGWQIIEATKDNANCADDFVLNYCFLGEGAEATVSRRRLTTLYTEATEKAYLLFNKDVQTELFANVCTVNANVNQQVTVDPALYRAFELLQQYHNRCVYLAPVYVEYNRMFLSANEQEAAQYDPGQNPELMPYIAEIAAFANDPQMIDIQLLGDNRVCLKVSEAYMAFAQEYEIQQFLDFVWMKNAFIADYIADILAQEGFTNGYLASYDGFTRNLDARGEDYTFNIFDRVEKNIFLPAKIHYARPMALVFLRDYPLGESDSWHYFGFSNGRIASVLIDPASGQNKSSVHNLVSYSEAFGCAEILLKMAPIFIADAFSAQQVAQLAKQQLYSVWCEERTVLYNEKDLRVDILDISGEAPYGLMYAGDN